MIVDYKVDVSKFLNQVKMQVPKIERAVDNELDLSSRRVEARAKYYAAWDTGLMSTSIHSLKRTKLNYEVISPVFYSIFVELGTRKMAAQPFVYPALQEDFPILMSRLNRIMKG